jgi:hypothetical protein
MVTPMSDKMPIADEPDPKVLALFAKKHEPLPSAEFLETFFARMDRARRMRTLGRIAVTILAVFAAAWIMPSVLDHTALVVRAVSEQATSYAPLVVSPWGWAASMLIGLAVILRTGALRRR